MTIKIYSKSGCPYCDKIKLVAQHLSETKGYVIEVFELGTHFNREEFYTKFEVGATFPQVFFEDKYLGGCSESVKYFKENNIL